MRVNRSGLTVTATTFPSGVFSINNNIYFTGITSGFGPKLYGDATNILVTMGSGNGGFYVQDSGGNNRAALNQQLVLWPVALGGTAGNQSFAFQSIISDGNSDVMQFLWNRNTTANGWGAVDFIIRRNVDGTNAQTAIFFTGTPGGPVFTVANQGAWRYSIDITNQAWILPASGGSYYWYSSASANIMQLTNAGSLTVSGSVNSQSFSATGGNAIIWFNDRGGSGVWGWYSNGGIARLYNGVDRFTVDGSGNTVTAGFATVNDFRSVNNVNVGGTVGMSGNYLSFLGFRQSLASGQGPMLYGDTNWIVAMPGTGNLGFMVYNSGGASVHQLRGNGDAQHNGNVWAANYYSNGYLFVLGNATYNQFYDPAGNVRIFLGNNGNSYYRNSVHNFDQGDIHAGGILPLQDNNYSIGLTGTAWYQVASYWFNQQSSRALKDDIELLPDALDRVLARIR